MRILLLDHHRATADALARELGENVELIVTKSAAEALEIASTKRPELVVMELSLAGHSGLEFLYEFRSYVDWQEIPIIVYSSVRLHERVLTSRAWKKLGISAYMYKPESNLVRVREEIQKRVN